MKDCELPHYSRSWCASHYRRWRKTGDVRPDIPIGSRQNRVGSCSVADCGRPINARRLCVGHLRRVDKLGDVLADVPLKRPWEGACSVEGCDRPHSGLGWCAAHYGPFMRYKVTPERYDALLAQQGGGCGICGTRPTEPERLHIDHDHACCPARKRSCGKCVRGLLCGRCNPMLGLAEDQPAVLQAAIDYLSR